MKSAALVALIGVLVGGTSHADFEESVIFERLSDGKILMEQSPDKMLIPASVTKLLTSAAVLAELGPAHQFSTKLYYSGLRTRELIKGDLYIVGDGDPFLVSEKLWQLAHDIYNQGISSISGDIYIDNSLFSDPARDESRKHGSAGSSVAYDAPVSPLGINFNSYAVNVSPGESVGRPGIVALDPLPLDHLAIVNRTVTMGSGKAVLDVRRTSLDAGRDQLIVTGTVPISSANEKVYASVGDHVRACAEYLRSFLRGAGITLIGQVRAGARPAAAKFLAEIESFPLAYIVAGLNKFSNNYIADVLVKRLGAEGARSGSYISGLDRIERFLRRDCQVKGEFVLENGSGLSENNRLSARQVLSVLRCMEKRGELFPDFLSSLPASGWNGTLEKRYSGELASLTGQVRAKTGTLTSPVAVAGLAGYFRHKHHGWIAFAMIHNGISKKPQPSIEGLRKIQDLKIARVLAIP